MRFKSEKEFRKWLESSETLQSIGVSKIIKSQEAFPDLKLETVKGRIVYAEVELKTSNFDHDENQVDLVIVHLHDRPNISRKFKVLELRGPKETRERVDDVLKSDIDLVYERIKKLPLVCTHLDNEMKEIKRYRYSWEIAHDSDEKEFYERSLEDLLPEFQGHVEVPLKHMKKLIESRELKGVIHPRLVKMAKIIAIRGVLELVKEKIIKTGRGHVSSAFAISLENLRPLKHCVEQKRKVLGDYGTIPNFDKHRRFRRIFLCDNLDANTSTFNYQLSNIAPAEACYTLFELSAWLRHRDASETHDEMKREMESHFYSVNDHRFPRGELSLEYEDKDAKMLAITLRDLFDFNPPPDPEYWIKSIYNFVVEPLSFLSIYYSLPLRYIKFFCYPYPRFERILRLSPQRDIGKIVKEIKKYYKEKYSMR